MERLGCCSFFFFLRQQTNANKARCLPFFRLQNDLFGIQPGAPEVVGSHDWPRLFHSFLLLSCGATISVVSMCIVPHGKYYAIFLLQWKLLHLPNKGNTQRENEVAKQQGSIKRENTATAIFHLLGALKKMTFWGLHPPKFSHLGSHHPRRYLFWVLQLLLFIITSKTRMVFCPDREDACFPSSVLFKFQPW